MRETFARLRVAFWVSSAGVLALYLYGLGWGAYSPLELGILSFVCVGLLVLFTIHEVLLRRELPTHPRALDQSDRARRGF